MVEHAAMVELVAMVERGSEPVMVETTPATVGEPIEPNLADRCMREGAATVEPAAMGEEGGAYCG